MLAAACGGGGAPAAGEQKAAEKIVKVASQSPLSGGQSAIGTSLKNGAELSLEQNKGRLEAMGFKVEMVAFDDQATPDVGVANAKKIVSDPAILCVVGHWNSGVQIPSSEEYHAAGLANISAANTNPKVTDRRYKEVSRIVGRDDMQGKVGAEFANKLGVKSAYIIHDKTAYGQGIAEFFKVRAEELGMKVVGFEGTEEKANFDAVLNPLLNANPELIYFGGIYDQAAVLFKQAREKGFMGVLLGPDGLDSSDLTKIGGPGLLEGKGTYYTTVGGPASLYPDAAKYIEDYKAKFGEEPQPYSAQAYDAMNMCLTAIENAAKAAGNQVPTRAAVADAVRALKDFKGITGTINFDSKGDPLDAKYYVMQVVNADPAKWGENKVIETIVIQPPP
ncbi:MAG: branched-chain amino acid ABC transporter substrate-binding protein [Anaerolineae bacterium]|nr:branched-chain amino acid ABC transporter substrate-binding protein [Anaerolineae bacterium]